MVTQPYFSTKKREEKEGEELTKAAKGGRAERRGCKGGGLGQGEVRRKVVGEDPQLGKGRMERTMLGVKGGDRLAGREDKTFKQHYNGLSARPLPLRECKVTHPLPLKTYGYFFCFWRHLFFKQ